MKIQSYFFNPILSPVLYLYIIYLYVSISLAFLNDNVYSTLFLALNILILS